MFYSIWCDRALCTMYATSCRAEADTPYLYSAAQAVLQWKSHDRSGILTYASRGDCDAASNSEERS